MWGKGGEEGKIKRSVAKNRKRSRRKKYQSRKKNERRNKCNNNLVKNDMLMLYSINIPA